MSFFKIRPMREDDANYVVSTTVKNYWKSSYFAKSVGKDIFFRGEHRLFQILISLPSTSVLIATDVKDDSTIFGFIVSELVKLPWDQEVHRALHYIYVKNSFRSFGIGKALLEASGMSIEEGFRYSHETIPFAKKPFKRVVYDPFILNQLKEME